MLEIKDLHVSIEGKEIIKGISFKISKGEKVALMGQNGSGKSSLANALMGNPEYKITSGKIILNGEEITLLSPEERAKKGIFLSFQHPITVPGVTLEQFLRLAYNSIFSEKLSVYAFSKLLKEKMDFLHLDKSFCSRYLNEGFSGGEKKKAEILQMLVLSPSFAVLDETDSGLDVDALKVISSGINSLSSGFLIITHYNRILNEVKPDRVLVMSSGKIIKEGDSSLSMELESKGFKVLS